VAKGRVPYVLFMLLDVLRAFPGQVGTSLRPCAVDARHSGNGVPVLWRWLANILPAPTERTCAAK
jgi:hypothetical protein